MNAEAGFGLFIAGIATAAALRHLRCEPAWFLEFTWRRSALFVLSFALVTWGFYWYASYDVPVEKLPEFAEFTIDENFEATVSYQGEVLTGEPDEIGKSELYTRMMADKRIVYETRVNWVVLAEGLWTALLALGFCFGILRTHD